MPPPRVKLIAAVLLAEGESLSACLRVLEARFGPTDGTTEPFLFLFSDYYRQEMGPNLRKVLISFEPLLGADRMVEVKRSAVELEDLHRKAGPDGEGRRLNIDPGFLAPNQFVLTSRKEADHRLYLAPAVYAEITLLYSRGRYRPLPWTYPDYRLDLVAGFLRKIRARFLRQLRLP